MKIGDGQASTLTSDFSMSELIERIGVGSAVDQLVSSSVTPDRTVGTRRQSRDSTRMQGPFAGRHARCVIR